MTGASPIDARAARRTERLNFCRQGQTGGRAARFAQRTGADTGYSAEKPLRFDALFEIPLWQLMDGAKLRKTAITAGLLHYRGQIDRELRGATLRQIAARYGEDLFDLVCDAPMPDHDARADSKKPFSSGLDMEAIGLALLQRSSDADETAVRALVDTAVHIGGRIDTQSSEDTTEQEGAAA